MPTTPLHTFGVAELTPATRPDLAQEMEIKLSAGTYAAGTALKATGTPGTYAEYDPDTSGDTFAGLFLRRACTVDGSGNHTLPGEWGATRTHTTAYFTGTFNASDIPNPINADDLAPAGVRLVNGLYVL